MLDAEPSIHNGLAAAGEMEDVEAKSYAAKRFRQWRQRQLGTNAVSSSPNLVVVSIILAMCTALLYLLSGTEDKMRTRSAELRLAHERSLQVRMYISGEPTFTEQTDDESTVDFSKYDILLLSGGANLHPSKSFWFAELLRPFTNIFKKERVLFAALTERRYADVMFRSSMCDRQREDLVAAVRSRVEAAGFTFKQEGKCGGTGYPPRVNRAWNRQIDRWAFCEECKKSKIVLAFERHTQVHNYLGEKLFLPMEYGAVPAYAGNGHPWIALMGVNPHAFVDRANYHSDAEFADAIVALLRDQRRLDAMRHEQIFANVSFAREMARMYVEPLRLGARAYPDLHSRIMNTPKLRRLVGRKVITFSTTSGDPFNVQAIVKALFQSKYAVRFERDDELDADIVVYRCC